MQIEELKRLANGRWIDALRFIGVPFAANKKHCPCPMCGGNDRFRVDDKNGEGTWICNQCGAGDGLELVKLYLECDIPTAIKEVQNALGIYTTEDYQRASHNAAKAEAARVKREKEESERKAEAQEFAATTAAQVFSKCEPVDDMHPYLIAKQIAGRSAMQCFEAVTVPTKEGRQRSIKGCLVISMRNEAGKLVNVQLISPNGFKMFLTGGMTIGAFHVIGRIDNGRPLLVAEGFATGATIHEQTRYTVIVAFNAGNILPVCESLKWIAPDSKLVIMGDNDWHLEDSARYKKPVNIGKSKAAAAAVSAKCGMMFPEWARGVSDFNDAHVIYGARVDVEKLNNLLMRG